ncbi:hypothetical protein HH297_00520, partial [Xanthomonas sp. Kuri4-3]
MAGPSFARVTRHECIVPDLLLRAALERVDRADAEALLLHALGRDRAWLFAHGRDPVDAAVA